MEKFKSLQNELNPPSLKASEGLTFDKMTTLDLLDKVLDKTDYLSLFSRESEENLARLENIKELRSVATEYPDLMEFLEQIALTEREGKNKTHKNNKELMNFTYLFRCERLLFSGRKILLSRW